MAITYASNIFTVANNSGTGTITSSVNPSTTVDKFGQTVSTGTFTGSGTNFTTELKKWQWVLLSSKWYQIMTVDSATSATWQAFEARANVTSGTAFTYGMMDTDLKTAMDSNPANGCYEGGACITKDAHIEIGSTAALTITDGTFISFDDTGNRRLNISSGGIIDFSNGGGITYNGNVSHSFFNGMLTGDNIVYRINGNVTNGRSDFFAPNTSSVGMTDLTIAYGKGVSGYSYFTHFENLAGKIDGLKLVNDITTSLGTGTVYMQFGDGTYSNVQFPSATSLNGITVNMLLYLARSGGNSLLISPVLRGSNLGLESDANGSAELRDEVWKDLGSGFGAITGANNTLVNRTFTFNTGSLYDSASNLYLLVRNTANTVTLYKNGVLTNSNPLILKWATHQGSTDVSFGNFQIRARRKNMVEQNLTISPKSNYSYSALNVIDTYYTNNETANLGNITVATSGESVTGITINNAMTLDKMYDILKVYLQNNLTVTNFLAPGGTDLNLGSVAISNIHNLSSGIKLKSVATTGVNVASGAISNIVITGNVNQDTPTHLNNATITGALNYNTGTNMSVNFISSNVGTVTNSGTGIITITPTNSTITTYTDAEINYLDSSINIIGSTSNTAYPTATDRNNNTNALATWTGEYKFKYAGAWASPIFLKMDIGFTAYKDVTLTLGKNEIDLGTTGLLSVIQSTMALESTSQKIKGNTDLIPALI